MTFLGFWSWAKGKENTFDANHRHRLHDVITRELQADETDHISDEIEDPVNLASGSPISLQGGLKLPMDNNGIRRRSSAVKSPKYDDDLLLVDGRATLVRLPVFALYVLPYVFITADHLLTFRLALLDSTIIQQKH